MEKEGKREREKKYLRERRVERKVESLVEKTIEKIRTEKEMTLRKKKIFNDYLF